MANKEKKNMQIDHKIQLAWNLIELLKIFLLKNGERQLKKKTTQKRPFKHCPIIRFNSKYFN